ncbi:hypothetical protein ACT3SP_17160 [Brachybacterium sp. AOP43-C2-M15]|uniref:hypothetical protein n=1 Tax=Brachybacterium sp. AOP43-C2-M15 TaxID=3457661 RepID=UPI0040339174
MDNLPFFLLLLVALIDAALAAWFIGQGARAGAASDQARPRLVLGGTLLMGALVIAALAFFLFPPFG